MNRGDKVIVSAYPDKRLERLVWDEHESYIVVCRPEVYAAATLFGVEPDSIMGFPKEDVVGANEGEAVERYS